MAADDVLVPGLAARVLIRHGLGEVPSERDSALVKRYLRHQFPGRDILAEHLAADLGAQADAVAAEWDLLSRDPGAAPWWLWRREGWTRVTRHDHEGPVQIRHQPGSTSVLCPLGHLVTARQHSPELAGSVFMADISWHQHAQHRWGGRLWTVTCAGATATREGLFAPSQLRAFTG